jgi:hypothetical protein
MNAPLLPEAFRDLEPYVAWSLASERERIAKRTSTPMDEIVEFHGAISNRIEAVIGYLNQYAYDEMPDDGRRLCYLALSLVEISSLVEMYKNPANLYMIDPQRFVPYE